MFALRAAGRPHVFSSCHITSLENISTLYNVVYPLLENEKKKSIMQLFEGNDQILIVICIDVEGLSSSDYKWRKKRTNEKDVSRHP